MQSEQDSGAPIRDHLKRDLSSPTADWEAIRVFLEVARCGSFRSAALALGVSMNPLRRHVRRLERQLATTLFTRHRDGVRLTPEAEQILEAAKQMEAASFGLIRARERSRKHVSGEVKVAITEGLGTLWVMPRLVEFLNAHPGLLVNLKCAMKSADVLGLEADLAIQLTKPTDPDVKCVKLGHLHSVPFAGSAYVQTFGAPKTIEEMSKHRFVLQLAEQTDTQRLFKTLFPDIPWVGLVALTTNTSTAHVRAVAEGVGIGWLPSYLHAISNRFLPLEVDVRFPFDIWLTYHADVGRIPRVRRMMEWLVESFDARRFPWFRKDFVHPNDLPRMSGADSLIPLIDHMGVVNHVASPPISAPHQTFEPIRRLRSRS